MTGPRPTKEDEFILCSVLEFEDETMSIQPLHRGSFESCREVADMFAAISYSGKKSVTRSYFSTITAGKYEELQPDTRTVAKGK